MPVRAFFSSGNVCVGTDFARLGLRRWDEILDLTKWISWAMAAGPPLTRAYYPQNLHG
jgi:hypothetical protein